MTSRRTGDNHLASRRLVIGAGLGGLAMIMVPRGIMAATSVYPGSGQGCDMADAKCAARMADQRFADQARHELNLGDAEAAADSFDQARNHWQQAIDIGQQTGSQAAIIAQKRLQMYTLTSTYNDTSLQKLLTSAGAKRLTNMTVLQQALSALGYYQGPLDGTLTELTRSAIRKYQRDMAFDETDSLPPRQIVFLVANGAETARDEVTQTTLALMYANGYGVVRSVSFSQAWLRTASTRGFGRASLFLALFVGTGQGGFPLMRDHATEYLKEACQQGNSIAIALVAKYGKIMDQDERWTKIAVDPVVRDCLCFADVCTT